MQQCMQMCMSTFTYYGGKKLEKIKLIPYKSLRDFWSGTRGKKPGMHRISPSGMEDTVYCVYLLSLPS